MSHSKLKRRMFQVLVFIVFGFMMLFGRLLAIQVIYTEDFTDNHINLLEKSVQQRKQEFLLSSGRGNIYDRNQVSLLEQREIRTVVVFPFSKDMINQDKLIELAKILNVKTEEVKNQIAGFNSPSYLTLNNKPIEISDSQLDKIQELNIPGVIATTYTIQRADDVLAKHVIGYLGQAPDVILQNYSQYVEHGILKRDSLIGRSGLQKTFQELLMGIGESKIAYFVDNLGHPLNGLASKFLVQEDSFYPLSLVTTLDKDIQAIAEEQLDKNRVQEGSVVILDVKNANILAMASTPEFNLYNVNPNSSDWNNKGVQVIEPGSTFKTLIAIAALEEGVVTPDEEFYCTGGDPEYKFTCHTTHGEITFEEAYAESCNIVFGEVAKRLGANKIEEYAERLGLTGQIGWTGDFFKSTNFNQIANEELNRVFHTDTIRRDPGSVMRTAIGQQDVRMSPLAMANLVVTVLNHGRVYEPRLVDKVIYKNGTDYYNFPIHYTNSDVGNYYLYNELKKMMRSVVEEGTGQQLMQATWNLAGKTGTAETNNGLVHQWFIGYGPYENPKYAMAVVVRKTDTRIPLAKNVFVGIMNELVNRN